MEKSFQENIVKYRNKRHLSFEEAAKALSFSSEQLSSLENGEREPTIDEIRAISKVYKVSYKKLLKGPKKKEIYKIKKQTLVGFNRYGMKEGWSVIVVPIIAFICLSFMFMPSFEVSNRAVSLMALMFLTNDVLYMVIGILTIILLGFIIIYWSVILALGHYTRAKRKVLNNVILAVGAGIVLLVDVVFLLLFKGYVKAGGIVNFALMFVTSVTQIVLLILMNLEGDEQSQKQVYTYHEINRSGYETKHWFLLGISALALVSFGLLFVIAYDGKLLWLFAIKSSIFELFFNSTNVVGVFIGGLCMAVLLFQVVYWIIICTLKRADRVKTAQANNVLLVVMNILLFIDAVAMMAYFGVEYLTTGGIVFYVSLFLTAIYGFLTIPIINSDQKKLYIQDEKGYHAIEAVQGQRPGKIISYKFAPWFYYIFAALLAVSIGVYVLESGLSFVAIASAGALLGEILFLICQRNKKFISVPLFIFGIILNTAVALFNIYLLGFSLFGEGASLLARIAMPLISGAIVINYVCMIFFLKPIRKSN